MYRIFGLRLGLNFGVRPAAGKNFYLRLTVYETFCDYAAVVIIILRLQLTVEIKKLKYKVKSLK